MSPQYQITLLIGAERFIFAPIVLRGRFIAMPDKFALFERIFGNDDFTEDMLPVAELLADAVTYNNLESMEAAAFKLQELGKDAWCQHLLKVIDRICTYQRAGTTCLRRKHIPLPESPVRKIQRLQKGIV